MKKILSFLLVLLMMFSLIGCVPQSEEKASTEDKKASTGSESKQLETLKVALQPYYVSLPVAYIMEKGWAEEAGIKLEPSVFSSGAPMNEALGAGLWDVGTLGSGAFPFSVASYDGKIIGNHNDGAGGNDLFVRPDSKIAKVKGFNPTLPEIYGDPDTVRGATILVTMGTSCQMLVNNWLEKIGVNQNDVKIVHMDYAQIYQAFSTGQGDIAALPSPFSLKAASEKGWKQVATLNALDTPSLETIVASKDAYKNKKELLTKFLKLIYRANDELEKDPKLKVEVLKKWYEKNGNQITAEAAKQECDLKPLITSERMKKIKYGENEKVTAEFFINIGKLEADKMPLFDTNVVDDILKMALN